MNSSDIKIGVFYRLRTSPNYSYIKPIEILKPKQKENPHNYIVVKCEHVVNKNGTMGFIRYFRLFDIIRGSEINES